MDKDIEDFLQQAKEMQLSEAEAQTCKKRLLEEMTKKPVSCETEECLSDCMNDQELFLLASARHLCLSDSEKGRAGAMLHAFMRAHPVNITAAVQEDTPAGSGIWSLLNLRLSPMLAAIALLVMGGGGLSYAAEYALPGDALYPIKIHVNEALRTKVAATVSVEKKTAWETTQANRRIAEAEALAAKGRLDAKTRTELVAAFQTHVQRAHENIHAIAVAGGHNDATNLNTSIETSLQKHAATLRVLAEAKNDDQGEVAIVLDSIEHATSDTVALTTSLNQDITLTSKSRGSTAESSSDTTVTIALTNAQDAKMWQDRKNDQHGDSRGEKMTNPALFLMKWDQKKKSSESSLSATGSSSLNTKHSSSTPQKSPSSSGTAESQHSSEDTASSEALQPDVDTHVDTETQVDVPSTPSVPQH